MSFIRNLWEDEEDVVNHGNDDIDDDDIAWEEDSDGDGDGGDIVSAEQTASHALTGQTRSLCSLNEEDFSISSKKKEKKKRKRQILRYSSEDKQVVVRR